MDLPERSSPSDPRRTPAHDANISRRRRKSLPSRSTSVPRSANHPPLPPASPEVISSLISSLSSISTPAQTHFDSIPHIGSHATPPSPNSPQSEFNSPGGRLDGKSSAENGLGIDYGAYKTLAESVNSSFLHPDDAAIAPVVRMAPAPTPPSPRAKSSFGWDSSPLRPTSRGSYASSRAPYDECSGFGVISTEPGRRPSRTASIASSSSGGRRSLKGQLGLLKKSSREFAQDKETDRTRKTPTQDDGLKKVSVARSRTSLRSRQSMADVVEEGGNSEAVEEFPSKGDATSSPDVTRASSHQSPTTSLPSPGGIGSGRFIPTRDSSLRHSYGKRQSARHSRYSSTGSKDLKIDVGIAEVKNETEQTTTQRIQQVKEQQKKIKTEMEKVQETTAMPTQTTSGSWSQIPRSSTEPPPGRWSQGGETFSKDIDQTSGDPNEESAPAPAVQTRRTREKKRQSDPPVSPLGSKHHKRTPSGPLSPVRHSIIQERPSSADSIDLAVEAYVSSPRLTQKVPHPRSGRMIAFSEVGDPKGHVVFCCLGMGLTRYLMAFYDELARTLKLRLITLDRPGVGESEPCLDGTCTPLTWPDDVAIVCNHLKITKFSILAHSAGAIYALATALRIPQHIRGRIHLLAPWIPPSQMSSLGPHKEPLPNHAVPYSQRILRALPTPILKVANSSFMNATSSSLTTSLPKSPRRTKRKSIGRETPAPKVAEKFSGAANASNGDNSQEQDRGAAQESGSNSNQSTTQDDGVTAAALAAQRERQSEYDTRLTYRIWELATTNANPAVDLLVCLERRQTIGFRYVDINREVVIHHGSKDTRVPVDNVRWLGKTMRRCEVRVLEGEGHGLMASAVVMSNVLTEIAQEWEDWTTVVQGRRGRRATITHHGSRSGIVV
ncbi:hypothetical protein VTN77DRAFT_3046 [Rasamsonia byssochlamydoides]|uniref:uncharacterized protein n=1 Tax=Rasamsonia byssochlamydoides TaxID=89139 RepID=UPI003744154F